jgi:hypothetical protein
MPMTRRRRANPPEQPENNNHVAEQGDHAVDVLNAEQLSLTSTESADSEATENTSAEGNDTNLSTPVVPPASPPSEAEPIPAETHNPDVAYQNAQIAVPIPASGNGERTERIEIAPSQAPIESGRRTMRGEYFRRQPLPPPLPVASPAPPVQLQPPTHEITLPLGKKPGDTHGDPLHLAYNPGYTGADEVRSALLHKLAQESKNGGRARCWNCGSIAVAYDRWNTRNRAFGEIGIAFCEICGVWSVL